MSERRISVAAEAAQLPALTRFLQEFCAAAALPAADALAFELALEEVFMNVVMHGAPQGRAPRVEVSLALGADGLALTVEDDGPAFDPLSLPPPDVAAGLEQRPVGGLGVHLVRRLMDAVHYHRAGDRNRLRLVKQSAR